MATQDPIESSPKRQKINNFDAYDSSHVYLLFNEKWGCFKIGRSNSVECRVDKFKINGFELLDKQRRPDSGRIESKILKFIKDSGFQTGEDLFEYQFDGWTECWHKDDLSPKSIDELIGLADRFKDEAKRSVVPTYKPPKFPIGDVNFEEMFAMAGIKK